MNYQEALDRLRNTTRKGWENKNDEKAIAILQDLVNEKVEQESRKDYLKVDSEWECVIRCNGMSFIHIEGTIVKISNMNGDSEVLTTPITELENYLDPFGEYVDIDEVFVTDKFLLCFKPVEKEGNKKMSVDDMV